MRPYHLPLSAIPAALSLMLVPLASGAGPLDPPAGPIAPTHKTLGEVEPRTPINGLNTPGDDNSTFRITTPGSYYLTSNVTGEAGKHGIEISATNVSIDLAGFSLVGVPGSFIGVAIDGARSNLAVRNGVVVSWGGDGINLFSGGGALNSHIENIIAQLNGGAGIRVAGNSVVRDCTVEENTGNGVTSNSALNISNIVARSNGGDGLFAGGGSTISNCSFRDNGSRGVFASAGGSITACSAYSNDGDGISVSENCSVIGCVASSNTGDGLRLSGNCIALSNTCTANGFSGDGAGVHAVSAGNRIEGNNCVGNDRGVAVDTLGNVIVRNTCRANTINWVVAAGNACFIVTAAPSAQIVGDAGGAPSTTDPNANVTY